MPLIFKFGFHKNTQTNHISMFMNLGLLNCLEKIQPNLIKILFRNTLELNFTKLKVYITIAVL